MAEQRRGLRSVRLAAPRYAAVALPDARDRGKGREAGVDDGVCGLVVAGRGGHGGRETSEAEGEIEVMCAVGLRHPPASLCLRGR